MMIITNEAGRQMLQKALIEEAKRELSTGKGVWEQLKEKPKAAQYDKLKLADLEKAIGTFFAKAMKKPNRRKMKKHGKTI